jgi:hypothetical protein
MTFSRISIASGPICKPINLLMRHHRQAEYPPGVGWKIALSAAAAYRHARQFKLILLSWDRRP